MQIRWERIVGVLLIAASIWLCWRLAPMVEDLLAVANSDDDRNPIKAVMLGVMCIALVGGIKLLVTRKGN